MMSCLLVCEKIHFWRRRIINWVLKETPYVNPKNKVNYNVAFNSLQLRKNPHDFREQNHPSLNSRVTGFSPAQA